MNELPNADKLAHALTLIAEHYGDRCAERSGVPLMNHITEGLQILDRFGASDSVKAAFCLHPLLQAPADYKANSERLATDDMIDVQVFRMAVDYRWAANAYLCKPETDHWNQHDIHQKVGHLYPELRLLLIADKEQNQKDFMLYHYNKHERSGELKRYFHNWLDYLGVSELKA
jgi:hypothetical protein